MKRFFLGSVFAILVCAVGLIAVRYRPASGSSCTTMFTPPVVSPTGAWSARVRDDACEGDFVFENAEQDTVILRSRSDASKVAEIFSGSGGGEHGRPQLSWTNDRTLHVSASTSYGNSIQRASFDRVKITYSFRYHPSPADIGVKGFNGFPSSPQARF